MRLPRTVRTLAPVLLAASASAWQLPTPAQVQDTFDPEGPFDHGSLVKDPATHSPVPSNAALTAPGASGLVGAPSTPFGGTTYGAPANDNCSNATIVPGDIVDYNPGVLDTTGALIGICDGIESCALNTTHSVWYSYTPDQDGFVQIETFNSNYDTVLSVFDACGVLIGGFICAGDPEELACNDNYFFNVTSNLYLTVDAGTNYKIKVSGKGSGGLLDFGMHFIPANDACADAMPIVGTAWTSPTIPTQNATIENCEGQEDCEFNDVGVSNSVWFSYVPPCDGTIDLNTNGSTYDTVLSVFDGCAVFLGIDIPCDLPQLLACDDDSGTGLNSQLVGVPVLAGVEYRIKAADYNTADGGGDLNLNFVFHGAGIPQVAITSPDDFGCVCGTVPILGTAAAGPDDYTDWRLEFAPAGASPWTELASGIDPKQNELLATWNTSGLAQGHYLLRLTAGNACGLVDSAVEVVFIDRQLDTVELRAPYEGQVHAGLVCLDGTAWDHCFDEYDIEYRPGSGGAYSPIGTSPYGAAVLNDPLGPGSWDSTQVPDGPYQVRLRVRDQCGNQLTEVRSIIVDNTPPVAEIRSPRACEQVNGVVTVIGTAADENLTNWVLQYTGGGNDSWVTIGSGTSPVVDGVLGQFDTTTLPQNCGYTLRVVAFDEALVHCDDIQRSTDMVTIGQCVFGSRVVQHP